MENLRWRQRLENFSKALGQLQDAAILSNSRSLSDLEKQGLIQAFEFTHELAWNVIKDYFIYQGNSSITGSRDAVREAFSKNLIIDGDSWMDMIKSRDLTSHTYNLKIANDIVDSILKIYVPLFESFHQKMKSLQ